MGIIEITVTACLHLVRSNLKNLIPIGVGSGVVVKYKGRFFLCTVSHFSDHPEQNVGLITGRIKNNQTELLYYGDFSSVTKIDYDEDYMDIEDLEYCFQHPERSGNKIDIAFKEIDSLENIIQEERIFNLDELGTIRIEKGAKSYLIVDEDYPIDSSQLCSFYGRIKPDFNKGLLKFEEVLYYGLPIERVNHLFFKMDLGKPITDHRNFKGCSGAPIIDTNGRLIGLVTHGDENPSERGIYGIRFDKVRQWIDLTYFQAS